MLFRSVQGGPLSIKDLRGKVVLVRLWTSGCPFCTRSAPALQTLFERYHDRGLVVVGIHHPKSKKARARDVVEEAVSALGIRFPVGIDNEWQTVKAYGVGTRFKAFTSISVLIDKQGVIRWVHDGGDLHPGGGSGHEDCARAWESLHGAIELALAP